MTVRHTWSVTEWRWDDNFPAQLLQLYFNNLFIYLSGSKFIWKFCIAIHVAFHSSWGHNSYMILHCKNCYASSNLCSKLSKLWSRLLRDICELGPCRIPLNNDIFRAYYLGDRFSIFILVRVYAYQHVQIMLVIITMGIYRKQCNVPPPNLSVDLNVDDL